MRLWRSRWAAVGAAVAVTLGAGGVLGAGAVINSGEKAVFRAITPCRLADTRPASAVGPRTSPLGPNEVFTLAVRGNHGQCTIPSDAVGVVANVTIVAPTATSYLTVWPADASRPNASNLNWVAGQSPTPNQVTSKLSGNGQMKLYNRNGSVHVLVDLIGYYANHTHDDRYYTKAQVDALAAPEFVVTGGLVNPYYDFVAESTQPSLQESVTTTETGRWTVSKYMRMSATCSPTSTSQRAFYILVDGVAVPSSFVETSNTDPLTVRLIGTTEAVIPAGSHTVNIGIECAGTNVGSWSFAVIVSNTSVLVHPA